MFYEVVLWAHASAMLAALVLFVASEILLILAVLGASYYWLSIPITVAIAVLLIILVLSYRQAIFAYPNGGGAYIVSRDNFGETAPST